ncbi:MAG: cupin domain-containing protein [Pedobacter sp.]|nr:MAG: cupin domain-containing protein [Pedobacter sp.]
MKLEEFINSGMLELYLIGALSAEEVSFVESMQKLHPSVNLELAKIESFFEEYAFRNAVYPNLKTDRKMELIFAGIKAEEKLQSGKLPLITAFSNAGAWLEFVTPLLPEKATEKIFQELLQMENGVTQVLIVSTVDIEQEVHESLNESFLILKGTCVCTIGNKSVHMAAGDFMQIPLFEPHNVVITSESVTAILQHVELA